MAILRYIDLLDFMIFFLDQSDIYPFSLRGKKWSYDLVYMITRRWWGAIAASKLLATGYNQLLLHDDDRFYELIINKQIPKKREKNLLKSRNHRGGTLPTVILHRSEDFPFFFFPFVRGAQRTMCSTVRHKKRSLFLMCAGLFTYGKKLC